MCQNEIINLLESKGNIGLSAQQIAEELQINKCAIYTSLTKLKRFGFVRTELRQGFNFSTRGNPIKRKEYRYYLKE